MKGKKTTLKLKPKSFAISFVIILFAITAAVSGFFLDSSIYKEQNIFKSLLSVIHIPLVNADYRAWFVLCFTSLFIGLGALVINFEYLKALSQGKNFNDNRWFAISFITFLVTIVITVQVDALSLLPYTMDSFINALIFLGSSYLVAIPVFIVLLVVLALLSAFGYFIIRSAIKGRPSFAGFNDDDDDSGEKGAEKSMVQTREEVFPTLCSVDEKFENKTPANIKSASITLNDLVTQFRLFLAQKEGLYFSLDKLRQFIAGMATSHLLILEGLSGTGKSSLARYFSTFIGEDSFFEPVQASWHDRTSLLGFYNDFTRRYSETEFLKRLYEFTYRPHDVNIMVLDEVNISRVEYYFADFLSIMEYPRDLWKVKVMQLPFGFLPPAHLEGGFVKIPENTWFIGTANKDDSTYTITDKVYDRAIAISFNSINSPFEVEGEISPIKMSYEGLNALFRKAIDNPAFRLTDKDIEQFNGVVDLIYRTFDLSFGNRVWNQIITFVPVFVACGGTKEQALDFLLARKYLYKIQGRFESFVKPGLLTVKEKIHQTYGDNAFVETDALLDSMIRKL